MMPPHENHQVSTNQHVGNKVPPVLRLPTEILGEIFDHVEGSSGGSEGQAEAGTKAIQSCRLTCRRFCDVSFSRLVRLIVVHYRLSSLQRLQDISRHPTISQGVLTVQIRLGSFEKPSDFSIFVKQQVALAQWVLPLSPCRGDQAAHKILESGRRIASGREESEQDKVHRTRLHTLYKEYQRLYHDQEALQAQGGFAEAIGAAFARMPLAKELQYEDAVATRRACLSALDPADADRQMYDWVLKVIQQRDDVARDTHRPPYYPLIRVPIAIRNAGVALRHVGMYITSDFGAENLMGDEETRLNFIAAMDSVQSFSFIGGQCFCTNGDAMCAVL
jgi:hypothetical protein